MADLPLIPPQARRALKAPPSFSNALSISLQRSADRLADGQLIYGPLTGLLDECLQSDTIRKLPAKLRGPLNALYKEISTITQRHFDSFLSSTPLSIGATTTLQPVPPSGTPSISPSSPYILNPHANHPPTRELPSTYATVVAAGPTAPLELVRTTRRAPIKAIKPPQDTRLFIRLSPTHPARAAGAYAMLTALKHNLKEDAHLIKEVQETKSGFALCTRSVKALETLEKHSSTFANLITDCKIEKQPNWVSYRITFIPRSVRILDAHAQIQNALVTDHILSEAIRDETNQQSTRVEQSHQSLHSNLFNTTWYVSFDADKHKALPRSLRILGTTATAQKITTKAKTIQCSKCFQWHNERSCSRPQKCSACGSSQHTIKDHPLMCSTASPHTCPARCIHCSGPHPADDPLCPLRPINKVPVTKTQRLAIIHSYASARLRAIAAAGCTKSPRTDTLMEELPTLTQPVGPTTPKTIRRPRTADGPPPTNTAARFFVAPNNPFSPLSFNASRP